jgi:hypothetical protein
VTPPSHDDTLIPADFSLFRGGLVYRIGVLLGLVGDDRRLLRLGVAIALVTWVPLALLSTFAGVAGQDPTITFWKSIGTHVRLLVTVPLFFFAEDVFDTRAADVLRRMLRIGLILPKDQQGFAAAVRRAIRTRDTWSIEAGIFVLTAGLIWFGVRQDLPQGVTTWRTGGDGQWSLAGWWYAIACIPTFQFLVWRWSWRLLVWTGLLWRISQLQLQLIPTHPDAAGGLGVLGVAHVDLAPLAVGASAILSSSYAEQMLFAGAAPATFAVSLTAIIVGATLALVLPLALFTPQLIDTKQRALLDYGDLAAEYTRAFASKWVDTTRRHDDLLGTADIQSLADLGGSFELIRSMTILPISRSQIGLLAGAAALPFAPLILLAFPIDQLIINSLKSLLSIA